jgi:arsenate reductase (glutaredoxin)
MVVILYGIKNCDSVKKAQHWLELNNHTFELIDFKLTPPTAMQLSSWSQAVGWEKLLNKQSKTFRELPAEEKEVESQIQAIQLMQKHPLLIKRPVLVFENEIMIGFSESTYNALNN